ncbi:DUF4037 domain-containing protein [uncultured Photobacterium sp.]|uniref:DUF4037 domain-containing protein n=1 Tax=uncultured Photobacterium sp. TaxID=173973 RepID=UPI0026040963|nr:DUF4037 domain-containing protein [uncultured Photobacterium sp.]
MENCYFVEMMSCFAQLEQVDAILLAGSKVANSDDALSDYDVYIYTNDEIPLEVRKEITERYCSYIELNNQFWETEDDGVLKDGTEIELIYRSLDWLDNEVDRVVNAFQASTGYSTCFWYNLINSKVIYDRNNRAKKLIEKHSVEFPVELRLNIIDKNLPLLNKAMPAFQSQIKKALERQDIISINHRIAEFISSYFDVLFAINEMPHPGEKKLVKYVLQKCSKIPESFEEDIIDLLSLSGESDVRILDTIDQMVVRLTHLLEVEGLLDTTAV